MISSEYIVMGGDKMHRKSTVINYFAVGVLVVVGVIAGAVEGDRTFTKVYEPIRGIAACFKRLNGTDEIGCRSSSKGDVGVLHVIEDQASLEWVLKTGPHDPYIAILYPEHFTRENLLQFRDSGRVNGVLLLPEKKEDSSKDESTSILKAVKKKMLPFSTDSTCPNNQFGFYNASKPDQFCQPWNKGGSALLFENFDFPIFFVRNETEAEALINYYKTFNEPINGTARDWPLCAGQLKSFMMAAKDTPTCLRRSSVFSINPGTTKVCDPLGDQNLVATLLPQGNDTTPTNQTKLALVIAARFDGASLFDEMSPSGDSAITGLVTLLTIIKTLGALKDQLVPSPNAPIDSVYFMLFNGEAFGYIGSSRMAYDMSQGKFPLKLEEIQYFLEVNQAAPRSSDQSYFIHQTEIGESKQFTDSLLKQAGLQNLTMRISSSPWGVPPSSLHSFLRERPDLTGLVITNHNESYRNHFYNSIFDTKDNLNYIYGARSVTSIQQRIASLAASISNTVLEILQDPSSPIHPINADDEMKETVDELLHCYLETSNCSLFRDIAGFDPSPNSLVEPYPMYVGVATYTNTLTQITHHTMVTYLGTQVENVTDKDTCFGRNPGADPSIASRSRYFINNTCYDTPQINMTEAKSPAFIIPGYDWSSGKYSTWTESVWQKFSVRLFLKPSLLHEILTLVSGLLVVLFSFGIARFVNAKSDLIFPSRTDAMVC